MALIVLVCGGRRYNNRGVVFSSLDQLHTVMVIARVVHGGATGADTLAGEWARARGVPERPYPIGPGEGGYGRNTRMLAEAGPHALVHFPGGNGTRDMVDKARTAGVKVLPGLGMGAHMQLNMYLNHCKR